MAWIKTISREAASDSLRTLYHRIAGPGGQIDNILTAHSLRPHTLSGHMALYKSVLHHRHNQLPRWFLEAIGVYVSRLNGCDYCDHHHAEGLRKLLNDEQGFLALYSELSKSQPGIPFTPQEQMVFAYVRTLTLAPGQCQRSTLEALKEAGFSDGEILEINQVGAYFAYANRMVLGLGVNAVGEALGLSPSNSEDSEDWGHR